MRKDHIGMSLAGIEDHIGKHRHNLLEIRPRLSRNSGLRLFISGQKRTPAMLKLP